MIWNIYLAVSFDVVEPPDAAELRVETVANDVIWRQLWRQRLATDVYDIKCTSYVLAETHSFWPTDI